MRLPRCFFTALVAAAICTTSTSNATPLDLKFGYGMDGYDPLSWDAASLYGQASALDVDGNIYTVGSTIVDGVYQSFVLAVSPLGFSRAYGPKGIAFIPNFAGFENEATSIVIDGDSKALIAGYVALPIASCSSSQTIYGFVARFATDGSIDNSFGNSTWTGTALVQLPCSMGGNASYLALDPSGRIVLTATVGPKNGDPSYVLVARFDDNGKPDSSFGTNGQVALIASDSADSLLATNIFVSSKNEVFLSAVDFSDGAAANGTDIFKLSQDGSLVSGFGKGGIFHYSPSRTEWTCCLSVDSSERIYFTGSYADAEIYVIRLTPAGAVDDTFGHSGTILFSVGASNSSPIAFVMNADGDFRILGYAQDYTYDTGRVFLLHANADGTLNKALGSGGVYEEPCGFSSCSARSMIVDKQNRPTITIYSGQPVLYRYDELFGAGFE